MSNLGLQVKIDSTWHTLTPSYQDFKIKKERDKTQIFVVRTIADGEMTFSCADYDLLIPYINGKLEGKLTENVCDNSFTYNCIIELSNRDDFYLKKITANITIVDRYFYLYEKTDMTWEKVTARTAITQANRDIDTENQIINIHGTPLDEAFANILFTVINPYLSILGVACNYTVGAADYIFQDAADLDLENIFITSQKSIQYFDDEILEGSYSYTLESLIDLLYNNFYLGYRLEISATQPNYYWLKFYWLGNTDLFSNGLDLRSYEDGIYQKRQILSEKDFARITIKSFDYDADTMNSESVYFATQRMLFDEFFTKTASFTMPMMDVREFDNGKDELVLCQMIESTDDINLALFDSQFYSIYTDTTFYYTAGDYSQLDLVSNAGQLNQIFPFDFQTKFVGLGGYYQITFTASGITGTVQIKNLTQTFIIGNGVNTITFSTTSRVSIEVPASETTQQTFTLTDFTFVQKNPGTYNIFDTATILGSPIKNGKLTPYYRTDFTVELPKEEATLSIATDSYSFSPEKYNNVQQEIEFYYDDTIESFDEFQLVQTSLGWMRCDTIERSYTSDTYISNLKLTLTKK